MNFTLNDKSCAQSGNTRTHLNCRMAMEEMFDRLLFGNTPNRSSEFLRDRKVLINARSVGTCFDIYFGRYKNLLQRSVKSISVPSLLSPPPFKRLQFTALPPAQHIEFYHLQTLITILASSYFPISCQTLH